MAQLGYLGPYNIDRLRPFATRGTRLGGVDELLAQRSAETINKLGLPTTQREDGTMSGPAVIYDGFRTPQDQANAIRSVAQRNRIPWNDSLLRTGIPGMAAPVGRSQHERGRAVDVLEPYVAAFRDNLAPDLRQPLPGSDANHFELVKQAQSVGAAPAGQGDAMAASGNDTMAAIPGATQPTQAYGGMMPEDVNYSRRMGEMLMRQGMSTAPVGHWTQALARVLQGASGGGWMADAQRGGREGQMAGNQALAAALANPSVTPAQYAQTALGNPYTAPQGQQMAQAVLSQRAKANDPLTQARIRLTEQQLEQGGKRLALDQQRLQMQQAAQELKTPEGRMKLGQQFGLEGQALNRFALTGDLPPQMSPIAQEILSRIQGGAAPQPGQTQQPSPMRPMSSPDIADPNLIKTQTAAPQQTQQSAVPNQKSPLDSFDENSAAAMLLDPSTKEFGKAILDRRSKQGFGQKTQNDIDTKISNAVDQLGRLKDIAAKFEPRFQTLQERLKLTGAGWMAKINPALLDKSTSKDLADFSTFRRRAISNINLMIKELSGAAVSVQEAVRLRQMMPDPGDSIWNGDDPITFAAKLQDVMAQTRLSMARNAILRKQNPQMLQQLARNNFEGVEQIMSLDETRAALNNRKNEIYNEQKSRFPDASQEQLIPLVASQLKQEFGI